LLIITIFATYYEKTIFMKIAVPTRDGAVDNHFGHCAYYTIYEVVNGEVSQKMTMASPQGCGCKSNIASVFREMGVRLLLGGSMGQGAKNVLESNGIEVIRGCSGDVDQLISDYLAGKIKDSGEGCHSHHDCQG
jgi:predicted Fe-Mo cluster-binding NifX family protein